MKTVCVTLEKGRGARSIHLSRFTFFVRMVLVAPVPQIKKTFEKISIQLRSALNVHSQHSIMSCFIIPSLMVYCNILSLGRGSRARPHRSLLQSSQSYDKLKSHRKFLQPSKPTLLYLYYESETPTAFSVSPPVFVPLGYDVLRYNFPLPFQQNRFFFVFSLNQPTKQTNQRLFSLNELLRIGTKQYKLVQHNTLANTHGPQSM